MNAAFVCAGIPSKIRCSAWEPADGAAIATQAVIRDCLAARASTSRLPVFFAIRRSPADGGEYTSAGPGNAGVHRGDSVPGGRCVNEAASRSVSA